MKAARIASVVFLVGVFVLVLYAGWERHQPDQFEAAFSPGGHIALQLSAGGYLIKGTADNVIRVAPDMTRGQVHCRMTVSGNQAKISVDGPQNNFKATIYVPQRSDLTVDQTIGDLEISGVKGNQNLSVAIGRIQVEVPDSAPRPGFDGSVMMGSLRANAWNVNKGGFFRSFYAGANGSPYTIKANIDIGDLETSSFVPSVGTLHSQQSGQTDEDVPDQDSGDNP
jgi:hypothetical protein